MDMLRRTIGGYARHPNFAAVIVVGLGCETNQIAPIVDTQGLKIGPRLQTMTIQDQGGTVRTIERGIALVKDLLPGADRVRRETLRRPTSRSPAVRRLDGYSGITRTRRWARPRTSSCATAARSSSRRAPRPTGPSTSSRGAP